MYEYKFIKIDIEGSWRRHAKDDYTKIVQDHAKDGWRLHQLFSPPICAYGTAAYIEIVLEREQK